MAKILIVEDEVKIATLLSDYLGNQENDIRLVHQGNDAMEVFHNFQPDIVLLDIMLPGVDGVTLLKNIRQSSQTPVMMITAKVEEIDRILALELGADDYVLKPFSPREVVARVKAILRRASGHRDEGAHIQLDESRFEVRIDQVNVALTAIEFSLLKKLLSQPGQIYNRDQLMQAIYPDGRIVSDRTIDSHIKKLRHKMLAQAPDADIIQSVYGVGYRYSPSRRDDKPHD